MYQDVYDKLDAGNYTEEEDNKENIEISGLTKRDGISVLWNFTKWSIKCTYND